MRLEEFEDLIMAMHRSSIKADRRLKEEDLREYKRMSQKEVIEGLNNTIKKFNTGIPELQTKDGRVKLWGIESGDIHIDIAETKEEIEISVFEIKRRWRFDKEEKS